MDLTYHPASSPVLMTGHHTVTISAPAADGGYFLDWLLEVRAGEQDVLLDRTPPPEAPGGNPSGGYAGLSVRFAKDFLEPEAVSTAGTVAFTNAFRGKALAMDYSGVLRGQPCGVAILDHAANLNHPTPWYVIRNQHMTYFSPAVINDAACTLKAGRQLVLRYRVIVHPNRWSAAQLNDALPAFSHK